MHRTCMILLGAAALQPSCDPPNTATLPAPRAAESDVLNSELEVEIAAHGLTGEPLGQAAATDIHTPLSQLGKQLFFSKHLSLPGTVACASCHHPLLGGGDGLALPVGVGAQDPDLLGPGRRYNPHLKADSLALFGPNVPRHSQTTFNVALYNRAMFFDGRIFVTDEAHRAHGDGQDIRTPDSIQNIPDGNAGANLTISQAKFPITSIHEMRGIGEQTSATPEEIRNTLVTRLINSESSGFWLKAFRAAFETAETRRQHGRLDYADITYDQVAQALSSYQRSQLFIKSPWYRYLHGDRTALDDRARRGALLFLREPDQGGFACARCHSGDHFSDERFHILAMPQIGIGKTEDGTDHGRHDVTRDEDDRFAFRTPALLNVAVTAPYGHDGVYSTLEDVIEHHLDPGHMLAVFQQESIPQLKELGLSYPDYAQHNADALAALARARAAGRSLLPPPREASAAQLADLVAFLRSLTDPCTENPACLRDWIPQPDEALDASVLQAHFGKFGDGVTAEVRTPRPPPAPLVAQLGSAPGPAPLMAVRDPGPPPPCANTPTPSAGDRTGPLFEDVTTSVGLAPDYQVADTTWKKATRWDVEYLGLTGGSAAADLNADCRPDLVVALGERVELWMSNRDQGFDHTLLRAGRYSGPAFADLDNDGDLDLFLGGMKPTPSLLLRNQGDGKFVAWDDAGGLPLRPGFNSLGAAFADIDRDGDLDAYIGGWDNSTPATAPHLWINDGKGQFTPGDSAWRVDVLYAGKGPDTSMTPNFVDVNRDGWPDLLLADDFERSKVLINSGLMGTNARIFHDLTDRSVITDENAMGVAIADFDQDGDMDWFVTAIKGKHAALSMYGTTGNRLYLNDGKGNFSDDTDRAGLRDGGWGWGACAGDFDNDGRLDIYHVNGYGDFPWALMDLSDKPWNIPLYRRVFKAYVGKPARLFMGADDGRFREQAVQQGAADDGEGRGISCLDYDRDGDLDVFIVNHAGRARLLRNNARSRNDNHFASFRLWQRQANPFAIGARVELAIGGRTYTQYVAHYNNYLSQNPPELHFGLGEATQIDSLRITWPDGAHSSYRNLPVDRFLTIERTRPE